MIIINSTSAGLDAKSKNVFITAKAAHYSDDETDAPSYTGELFGAPGVVSRPTEDGTIELLYDEESGTFVAGRSTNSGPIYGELDPGDTAVFTTHENLSSRLLLKGQNRQVVLMGQSADGKQQLIMIDSNEKQIIISGFGSLFEINQQGIFLQAKGGAALELTNEAKLIGGRVGLGSAPTVPAGQPGSPSLPSTTVFISP